MTHGPPPLDAGGPAWSDAGAALLPSGAVYNSLWLASNGSSAEAFEASPTPSPLRLPLKSLSAAAAAAVGGGAAVAGHLSPGHLIAPLSRAASFEEHDVAALRPAKQPGPGAPSDGPGSPRIGALLRRLSEQPGQAAAGGGEAPTTAAPAAEVQPYTELVIESSSGSDTMQGIVTHASPAHLLAPAQPAAALLWDSSPPAVELQLVAAPGSAVPLLPQMSSLSSPGSGEYAAADSSSQHPAWPPPLQQPQQQLAQQQQQQQPLPPPEPRVIRRSLADDFVFCLADDLPDAPPPPPLWRQQQQQQQQQQQPLPQEQRERSIAGLQALAAAQRRAGHEGSPVSAATSGSLRRHASVAAAAGPAVVPALQPSSPEQRPWTIDGGFIDLDLLADSLPQAEPPAAAAAAAAAVPTAAAAAAAAAAPLARDAAAADEVLLASPVKCSPSSPSLAAGDPGSPLSLALSGLPDAPADAAPAADPWTALHGAPADAAPAVDAWAAAAWAAEGQQRHDDEPPQHAVGLGVAGEYARLSLQFEQLDLRRIRRAVRISCKRQEAELGAAAPSLLERLLGGCFSGKARTRKLRRGLERERLHLLCLGRLPYSPDEPLHFELFSAVCLGFTGLDAICDHPCELGGADPAYVQLGCAASNPARELGDCGVLPLLMLLMSLERTPKLAARLFSAALGSPVAFEDEEGAEGSAEERRLLQAARLPAFSLAEVATEVTGWTLRLLGAGTLNRDASRLGSATGAAEAFWLGGLDAFLQFYEAVATVSASSGGIDQRWLEAKRLLLAVLMQAQGRACSDPAGTVSHGQRMF